MPVYSYDSMHTPVFKISINSVPIPKAVSDLIMGVSITESTNPPNQFSFDVYDPDIKLIDPLEGLFLEGSKVEIEIGYENNTRKMIEGEISILTLDLNSNSASILKVEGFDLLHRMTRGTFYRKFDGATPDSGLPDSTIVEELASKMGLKANADATPDLKHPRVQNNVTDLTFLEKLAGLNGYFLWMEGETLYFKKERSVAYTIELEWGYSLISFYKRLSTVGIVNEVEARGWDPVKKDSFSGNVDTRDIQSENLASSGLQQISRGSGGVSKVVLRDTGLDSQQQAQAYAQSSVEDMMGGILKASGSSIGLPDIMVGTNLDLLNIGRYSATYVVEKTTHTINQNGYRTNFELRKK